MAAVEEAVVNAVYHRSYEIREPVEVRISQEDLVVLSFPGPDRSIPLDQLRIGKAVSRRYRNRRIGEFLKELDLTEGRSTGISKIVKAMKANGSPAPEFETDEDRSYFLVRLPVHLQALRDSDSWEKNAQDTPHDGGLTPQATPHDPSRTAQDAAQDTAHGAETLLVPPLVQQLLEVCQGQMSREELQRRLRLTHRQHFSSSYLTPALELGLLEMTIPEKPRSKNQRYRLTEAGRRWREERGN